MIILGINRILGWVQITTGHARYTCPTKEIDGELFFRFKKEWHKVDDYILDYTHELVYEGKNVISRIYRKEH
ncbi:MAG: hypothetical protein IJN72_08020 [Firmicutes bacterium]|nr:hypothetical protein [Bacillota bacterium]